MQSPSKGMPTAFIASRSTDNLAQSAAAVRLRSLAGTKVIYSKYSKNSNQSFTFLGRLGRYDTAENFCKFVKSILLLGNFLYFHGHHKVFLHCSVHTKLRQIIKEGIHLIFFIQTPIFSQQGYLNRDLNTSSNVLIQVCYLK